MNRFTLYLSILLSSITLFISIICSSANPEPLPGRMGTPSDTIVPEPVNIPLFDFNTSHFDIQFDTTGISSLKHPPNHYNTEFIGEGEKLGIVRIRYRHADDNWQSFSTSQTQQTPTISQVKSPFVQHTLTFQTQEPAFTLKEKFWIDQANLVWEFTIENNTNEALELGDIAIPLNFNHREGRNLISANTQRVLPHKHINGHGSFIYWTLPLGDGPYLVMTPDSSTKLEFFERNEVYIHSAVRANEEPGTWRQPHTSRTLQSKGSDNDAVTYRFRFKWAQSLEGVRDVLYTNHGFDFRVTPGMVVPTDLDAQFALRTQNHIQKIEPEYPDHTHIQFIEKQEGQRHLYRVRFSRLGENYLKVRYGQDQYMLLEFFVTEPMNTLIEKRAEFLVDKQQHRDPSRWWNGLFSQWDMEDSMLLSPVKKDGLADRIVANGDPILGKAAYLARKNFHDPDSRQIEALEYHINHYIWGKMQRTGKEHPYPWGVYQGPNWHVNRTSEHGYDVGDSWSEIGKGKMFRAYNYTHIVMLYFNMYKIARNYPEMVEYADANEYLRRAYETARAYYRIPYSIQGNWGGYWDWAYKTGVMNEMIIPELADTLHNNELKQVADELRGEWEKKVKYFIYDQKYPFNSEFLFDRTAFESTYQAAKYAVENPLEPDSKLWYDRTDKKWYSHPSVDPSDARDFMETQHKANVAQRGWLEPAYYYMGSGTCNTTFSLEYMSHMGGYSVLDYGLRYADNPYPWIRLGYASYLSSWALMNTGTPESNYGYWSPGKINDGALGGAFSSEKYGRIWLNKDIPRGPWPYDAEIDMGLGAALRMASTVLADDPIFGWTAFGGKLTKRNGAMHVIPADGIAQQLHFVDDRNRFHLKLSRDRFAKNEAIELDPSLENITFTLSNQTGDTHTTGIILEGLPEGKYQISGVEAHGSKRFSLKKNQVVKMALKINKPKHVVTIKRIL